MGWWNTGFESAKNAYDYDEGGQHGPRRFWMPSEATRRIIFLDENPVTYWEHNFKLNGNWRNWEPCKKRNKQDNSCALCERYPDVFPSFVGILSIINMTAWESRKGREINFKRELLVAKLGGKDKPGILKRLERKKKEHGRLRGAIFDVYRSGAKVESVGDEYTMIEMVEPADIVKYGKAKLAEWVAHVNENLDPKDQVNLDKLWERDPWTPFDYDSVLSMRSNEELKALLGSAGNGGGGDDSSSADEDAPY
jgi:hypothetical protein